jgi:copper transport protein
MSPMENEVLKESPSRVEVWFEDPVVVHSDSLQFKNQPEFERVRVKFSMPPLLWRVENNAFYLGNGTYRLSGGFIHASGTMKMEVVALKPDGEKVVFPFQIVVPGEIRSEES